MGTCVSVRVGDTTAGARTSDRTMEQLEPANHRDRVAASGVDLLLVLLLGSGALAVTSGAAPSLRLGLVLLAVGLPTFIPEATIGRTLGKAGVQLRHAQPGADDHPLSLPQVAGRFALKWVVPTVLLVLGLWFPALVWWTGLYLPALGPTRRTLHDRLTRSSVLGPTEHHRAEGRAHDY